MDLEWNIPTKLDYYLAQIAHYAFKGSPNARRPNDLKTDGFLIKFDSADKKTEPLSPEERLQRSKAFWGAIASHMETPPPQNKRRQ